MRSAFPSFRTPQPSNFLFLLLLSSTLSLTEPRTKLRGKGSPSSALSPSVDVAALVGSQASLPCSIAGGVVYTVLWYRAGQGEPLYTFDGRERSQEHWSSDPPEGFGNRALLLTDRNPASLVIEGIRLEESGIYRCRVDFKANQTQNHYVNLSVILPPKKPKISWDTEKPEEAFRENGPLKMICVVKSGLPAPTMSWSLGGEEELVERWKTTDCPGRPGVSVVRVTTTQSSTSTQFSRLDSPCVPRSWAGASLGCSATNNNISRPAHTSVRLKIHVSPLAVQMSGPLDHLSAGTKYTLVCTSWGSSPPATLTWWKGGKIYHSGTQSVSPDKNSSSSSLDLIPNYKDSGENLTCRAENHELSRRVAKEDHIVLNILYAPRITLSFGASIDHSNIEEGNDVYFECHIEANPSVYKVEWRRNGVRVEQDQDLGVIVSSNALVLQSVRQESAGLYTCLASNIEGDTESNSLDLQIFYKPVCSDLGTVTIGVAGRKKTSVSCKSRAFPKPQTFRWVLNTTENMETLKQTTGVVTLLKKRLGLGLGAGSSLGALECWPSNSVGEAATPCMFELVAAGLPEPPDDCQVTNETNDSLSVMCSPGWSGGMRQTFYLELWDTGLKQKLLRNLSTNPGQPPNFDLANLLPGKRHIIKIYSANNKGRSEKTIELESSTSKVAELQIDTASPETASPRLVLGSVVGAAALLVLTATIGGVLIRCHRRHQRETETRGQREEEQEFLELQRAVRGGSSDSPAPLKEAFLSSRSEEGGGAGGGGG